MQQRCNRYQLVMLQPLSSQIHRGHTYMWTKCKHAYDLLKLPPPQISLDLNHNFIWFHLLSGCYIQKGCRDGDLDKTFSQASYCEYYCLDCWVDGKSNSTSIGSVRDISTLLSRCQLVLNIVQELLSLYTQKCKQSIPLAMVLCE